MPPLPKINKQNAPQQKQPKHSTNKTAKMEPKRLAGEFPVNAFGDFWGLENLAVLSVATFVASGIQNDPKDASKASPGFSRDLPGHHFGSYLALRCEFQQQKRFQNNNEQIKTTIQL